MHLSSNQIRPGHFHFYDNYRSYFSGIIKIFNFRSFVVRSTGSILNWITILICRNIIIIFCMFFVIFVYVCYYDVITVSGTRILFPGKINL